MKGDGEFVKLLTIILRLMLRKKYHNLLKQTIWQQFYDQLLIFASKQTFSTPYLNQSTCTSLLIRHSVNPTQASSLGLLITFVNNFHFNLVVMFLYLVNQLSVVNLIYSKALILL